MTNNKKPFSPLIVFAVPVYRLCEPARKQYFEKTVDNILGQTYKNILLLLLLNDSSDDNFSNQLLHELSLTDSRVIFLKNETDRGIAFSRWRLYEEFLKLNADYLCFCDADDYYELNFAQKCVSFLEKVPNVDKNGALLYFPYFMRGQSCAIQTSFDGTKRASYSAKEFLHFARDINISNWAKCLSRKAVEKSRYALMRVDESLFKGSRDIEIVSVTNIILNSDRIYIMDEPLYYYNRNSQTSGTWRKNNKQKKRSDKKSNRYLRKLYREVLREFKMTSLDIHPPVLLLKIIYDSYLIGDSWTAKSYQKTLMNYEFHKIRRILFNRQMSFQERMTYLFTFLHIPTRVISICITLFIFMFKHSSYESLARIRRDHLASNAE